MIDSILKIIKDDIQTFLNLKMQTGGHEDKIRLAPIVDLNGSSSLNENNVCMNLVKIEEERINSVYARKTEIMPDNQVIHINPPVKLNLYLLFAASFNDYTESLKFISYIISFFQTKKAFTPANTPALDPALGNITMEIYNQPLEEQNHMWGMLGTSYLPSVMYRLRMIIIQEDQVAKDGALASDVKSNLRSKT